MGVEKGNAIYCIYIQQDDVLVTVIRRIKEPSKMLTKFKFRGWNELYRGQTKFNKENLGKILNKLELNCPVNYFVTFHATNDGHLYNIAKLLEKKELIKTSFLKRFSVENYNNRSGWIPTNLILDLFIPNYKNLLIHGVKFNESQVEFIHEKIAQGLPISVHDNNIIQQFERQNPMLNLRGNRRILSDVSVDETESEKRPLEV